MELYEIGLAGKRLVILVDTTTLLANVFRDHRLTGIR